MIRDKAFLEKAERVWKGKEKPDFFKNLRIIEALYKEAVCIGVLPLKDPLEGIEVDIKIAKVINSV